MLVLLLGGIVHLTPASAAVLQPDSVRVWDLRTARERDLSLAPVEAEGNIHFTADGAVLFDAEGRYVIETYLAIPHTALEWVRTGQQYRADLGIEVRAADATGRESRELVSKQNLVVESFDATRRVGAASTAVVTGSLSFRPVEVRVVVSDLRSTKKTLIGRISGANESGEATFMLPIPRRESGRDELSSLVFGTRTERTETERAPVGTVLHGGVVLRPNPTRFVGLEHEVFPVYFEIYQRARDGAYEGEPEPRVLRYRVATSRGEELLTSVDEVEAAAGRWGRVQRFDVSAFPTGTYVLSVELAEPGGSVLDIAYGEFHVLWQDHAWSTDEATILEDARVLLRPEEFSRFEAMPPGQRAAYMAQLWERLGASATGEGSGLRQKFRARLERAERLYGGIEGGKLSDRGRVLIRYGEPQEIIPVRIPSRRDTFEHVLREELSGSLSNTIDTSDPRLLSFYRRNFQGNPAFEIWKYYGGGDPILEEQRGPARGMAFIFVDETGVGIYQLGYTNVVGIN
jgi:GWxTD domain-containing protein